jgi:hypothetical protein
MTTQSASEKKETRFERRTSVPILESDNLVSKQAKRKTGKAGEEPPQMGRGEREAWPNKGFRAADRLPSLRQCLRSKSDQ